MNIRFMHSPKTAKKITQLLMPSDKYSHYHNKMFWISETYAKKFILKPKKKP